MTKLYAYLIGALLAVLLVGGLFLWGQQGHQKARSAVAAGQVIATQRDDALKALEAFKRDAAKTAELTRKRLAVAEQQRIAAERRAKELGDALEAARGWSDTRIPDGVRNALGPDPASAGPVDRPRGPPGAAGSAER